ncbi:unnamed protein product [Boreogadus saida]
MIKRPMAEGIVWEDRSKVWLTNWLVSESPSETHRAQQAVLPSGEKVSPYAIRRVTQLFLNQRFGAMKQTLRPEDTLAWL